MLFCFVVGLPWPPLGPGHTCVAPAKVPPIALLLAPPPMLIFVGILGLPDPLLPLCTVVGWLLAFLLLAIVEPVEAKPTPPALDFSQYQVCCPWLIGNWLKPQ